MANQRYMITLSNGTTDFISYPGDAIGAMIEYERAHCTTNNLRATGARAVAEPHEVG